MLCSATARAFPQALTPALGSCDRSPATLSPAWSPPCPHATGVTVHSRDTILPTAGISTYLTFSAESSQENQKTSLKGHQLFPQRSVGPLSVAGPPAWEARSCPRLPWMAVASCHGAWQPHRCLCKLVGGHRSGRGQGTSPFSHPPQAIGSPALTTGSPPDCSLLLPDSCLGLTDNSSPCLEHQT